MSELTAAVDAAETLWEVDAVPDPEFGFYTVGSEIVQVIAGFPGGDPGYAVGQTFPAKIRVIRATNGTTAATHADGVALTAANAFSGGDSSVPDPSTGDDGDVPQVESGVYVLGPGGGAVTLRQAEVVLAFGDAVAGVTLATLTEGETMFLWSAFEESAITATQDAYRLDMFTGATVLTSGIFPNSEFNALTASLGIGGMLAIPVRGVTVVVKRAAGSSGTWTAGSIRFIALIGSAAAA